VTRTGEKGKIRVKKGEKGNIVKREREKVIGGN